MLVRALFVFVRADAGDMPGFALHSAIFFSRTFATIANNTSPVRAGRRSFRSGVKRRAHWLADSSPMGSSDARGEVHLLRLAGERGIGKGKGDYNCGSRVWRRGLRNGLIAALGMTLPCHSEAAQRPKNLLLRRGWRGRNFSPVQTGALDAQDIHAGDAVHGPRRVCFLGWLARLRRAQR